jgi:ring-1,2-phenylacetyl-CoA epoxidase subunit PaaE
MTAPEFHRLIVARIRQETPDAVSIVFAVPEHLREAYRFTPGQYLTLRATIDGEDLRRSYSICSGLDDGELRVAVKRVEGGVFSNWLNDTLRPGDTMEVMTPMGRFGVPPAEGRARTIAAFAAGSGITPVLSIMKTVLAREPASRFFLFFGNRNTQSILFRDRLEDLKDRYLSRLSVFHVLSREQQDISALDGHLDPDKLRHLLPAMLPPASIDQALICGPLGMIEGLETTLLDFGLPHECVHVERFTPTPGSHRRKIVVAPAEPPRAIATIIHEGASTIIPVANGETIIDAAIRAGLNLPYSCKGGMCCTCRARLLEGEVEMEVNFSLEPWETEAGYVLTCQSRPTTGAVVLDYDQV